MGLDPIVLTSTRVHYVLGWHGRECASIEIVSDPYAPSPKVLVRVTPDDDDVSVTLEVVPR